MDSQQPLIVIVGETASGKSTVATELAIKFNGEIICADSWTVRRGVNIGTAKPSEANRQQVKHHLLDVVEPCEDFTASVFKDMAEAAVEDIASKHKLPILVGGTGLYIDGVLYDYSFLPEGDRQARQNLESKSAEELVELAKSQGLDTREIDIHNKRRVIRLIESRGQIPSKGPLRPNTLIVGLKLPSELLKPKIIKRVDEMLIQGLETEVRGLADNYGWQCEALKGIGYAEWQDYFEGSADLVETKQKIISSTLRLAKKQRTWFKRNKSIQWVNDPSKVVDIVTTFLNTQDS